MTSPFRRPGPKLPVLRVVHRYQSGTNGGLIRQGLSPLLGAVAHGPAWPERVRKPELLSVPIRPSVAFDRRSPCLQKTEVPAPLPRVHIFSNVSHT